MPQNNEIQLRSDEVQEVLTAIPSWLIRWGSVVLCLIVIGIFSLSYFIKYPETIPGAAIITSRNAPAYIYPNVSGYLTKTHIKNNGTVKDGELIAEVNNTLQADQIELLQSRLTKIESWLNQKGDKLNLEIEEEEPTFGEIQNNYNDLVQSVQDLAEYQSPYYQNRIDQLALRIKKYEGLDKIYDAKIIFLEKEVKNIEYRYNVNQTLYSNKAITKMELLEKESMFNTKKIEEQDLLQAKLQNQISLADTKNQLDEMAFNHREKVRKLTEQIWASIKLIRGYLWKWKHTAAITAPIGGRVVYTKVISDGQYVKSEEPLMAIVPEYDSLIAKVKVPLDGYGKINIGQKVRLSLEHYPFQEYGYIYGRIQNASILPEKNTYELVVLLPSELTTSYGYQIDFKPDMGAFAEIIVDDQRLIEKFFYSIRKALKTKKQQAEKQEDKNK